jgi:hypothetical protein
MQSFAVQEMAGEKFAYQHMSPMPSTALILKLVCAG